MAVTFYFDVHVPLAVAQQLVRRGVDVLRVQADGHERSTDEQLLARATELGRILVTMDIRFAELAKQLSGEGVDHCGLVFAHALHITIGQFVLDLELIARACTPADFRGTVQRVPL